MKSLLARPLCALTLLALAGCSSFGPGWQSSALDPDTRFAPPSDSTVAIPATLDDRCSAEAWRAAAAYPQARELAYIQSFRKCMAVAPGAATGRRAAE